MKYSFLKLGADLTEFVAVKSLGLFGSKVTRGILVAVFSAWEENLNNVSEGIREITCRIFENKGVMSCVFFLGRLFSCNKKIGTEIVFVCIETHSLSLFILPLLLHATFFLFNGRFVWVHQPS